MDLTTKNVEQKDDAVSENEISRSVTSGFSWTALSLVGKQVFQFVILAILARLLTPNDFGLIALILVITDFVAIFNGELGFAEALIQRKELKQAHLYSVFWLNILIGCFIGSCIFIFAPVIARFYGEPRLVAMGQVLAINFPIYALRTIPLALLRRSMSFKLLGIIELSAIVLSGTVAVFLAYNGFGVWSLVWRTIITMTIMVTSLWFFVKWRPKFAFDRGAIRELWNFSSNMIGFYAWDYWTRRGDNFLIGKLLGSIQLGLYTRAYTNALIPYQIALVSRRVMLPALSKIQNNNARTRELYLNMLSYIAMIAAPVLFGLSATASNFVLLIYGPKWLPMVPSMRWLCIIGFLLTIGSTVDSIYQSRNRTDLLFRWGVISGVMALASFGFGAWLGSIEAVAISYSVTLLFLSYWNFTIPGRLIGMSYIDVIRAVDGYVYCALGMAFGVYAIGLVTVEASLPARFCMQLTGGIALYIVLLSIFEREKVKTILLLFRQIITSKMYA